MIALSLAMLVVVLIAAGTVGLVFVGIEGRGADRVPRVAARISRAARHLNGEGRTPRSFTRLLG